MKKEILVCKLRNVLRLHPDTLSDDEVLEMTDGSYIRKVVELYIAKNNFRIEFNIAVKNSLIEVWNILKRSFKL